MTAPRSYYRQGPLVEPTPYLRWVRRRCEWAARDAGVKVAAVRRIRWQFVRGLSCKDAGADEYAPLFGRVKYGKGGAVVVVVDVSEDSHVPDTAVHEFAHALLEPVEGVRSRGDPAIEEPSHSAVWGALYAELYTRFIDLSRAGPQEDAA